MYRPLHYYLDIFPHFFFVFRKFFYPVDKWDVCLYIMLYWSYDNNWSSKIYSIKMWKMAFQTLNVLNFSEECENNVALLNE